MFYIGDPIHTTTPDGSIIVKHREYLGTFDNVSTSATYNIVDSMAFALTPESMYFEWINRMSDMYTFWRWRALKYKFKSKVTPLQPTAVPATLYALSQRATITAFCDYDARNFSKYVDTTTVPSKNAMLDSQGGKCVEISSDFDYVVQCGGGIAGGALFSPIEGSKDVNTLSDREVNFGTLVIRHDSNVPFSTTAGARTQMYDIWVEYEIEFVKPKAVELFNLGAQAGTGYAHYTLDAASMTEDIKVDYATPNQCFLGGGANGATAALKNYGISPFILSSTANSNLARKIHDNIGVCVMNRSFIHFHPRPKERYLVMVVQYLGGTMPTASGALSIESAGSAWVASGGDDRLISTDRGTWASYSGKLICSIVVEAGSNTVSGGVVAGQGILDATTGLPSGAPQSGGAPFNAAHQFRLSFGAGAPYVNATTVTEAHLYVIALGSTTN